MSCKDEWFGIVRWHEDDIRDALEQSGYEATDEAVGLIRQKCEHHFFKDNMISAGWDCIYAYIGECSNSLTPVDSN